MTKDRLITATSKSNNSRNNLGTKSKASKMLKIKVWKNNNIDTLSDKQNILSGHWFITMLQSTMVTRTSWGHPFADD